MQGEWLQQCGKKKIILFCNGWGMDGQPFRRFSCESHDVYTLYDYRDLKLPTEVGFLWERYSEVVLVAWSMGVWVGQTVFGDQADRFTRAVAINGTLCPIDDRLGIPRALFDNTLAAFDEETRSRFYRRMCRHQNVLRAFLEHQPRRAVDDQREELQMLSSLVECRSARQSMYSLALIADDDHIFPVANQQRFWPARVAKTFSGPHYLFPIWPSWDQLLVDIL